MANIEELGNQVTSLQRQVDALREALGELLETQVVERGAAPERQFPRPEHSSGPR